MVWREPSEHGSGRWVGWAGDLGIFLCGVAIVVILSWMLGWPSWFSERVEVDRALLGILVFDGFIFGWWARGRETRRQGRGKARKWRKEWEKGLRASDDALHADLMRATGSGLNQATGWTADEVERMTRVMVYKTELAGLGFEDLGLEGVIRNVVADTALVSDRIIAIENFESDPGFTQSRYGSSDTPSGDQAR